MTERKKIKIDKILLPVNEEVFFDKHNVDIFDDTKVLHFFLKNEDPNFCTFTTLNQNNNFSDQKHILAFLFEALKNNKKYRGFNRNNKYFDKDLRNFQKNDIDNNNNEGGGIEYVDLIKIERFQVYMSYVPTNYQENLENLKDFDYYYNNISGILFTFVLYDKEINISDLIFDQIDINNNSKFYFEYNDVVISKVVNNIKKEKLKTKKENLIEKIKEIQKITNNNNNNENEDQSETDSSDNDDDVDNNNSNSIVEIDNYIHTLKVLKTKIDNLRSTTNEQIRTLSSLNKDIKTCDIDTIKENWYTRFSITVPDKDLWYGGIIKKKYKQNIGNVIKNNIL